MSRISEIKHDLRAIPCLSGLKDEDLISIGQMAHLKKIPKNHIVFLESDPTEFLFIVKNGAIKLYKTSQEGRELLVKIIGQGDYFCCAPLYGEGKYFVNAAALEDSTLIAIPSDNFKEMLCGEMGEMGLGMLSSLCGRLKHLSSLLEDITFKDVEQRIVFALLRVAEEKSGDSSVFLALTHHDIASITGSVRVVVSRTMSRLKKEGTIIESTHKGFRVDKEKLRAKISDFSLNP